MSFLNSPLTPIRVRATTAFEGERVQAEISVIPEIWDDADARKVIRDELRMHLARAIAERLEVNYYARVDPLWPLSYPKEQG